MRSLILATETLSIPFPPAAATAAVMAAIPSLVQIVAFALAVCLTSTAALPPRIFALDERRDAASGNEVVECTPSPDGAPLPVGCRGSTEGVSYGPRGDMGVVEVVEGAEGVSVVEDALAGTFVIRVPEKKILRRERCPYLHVYIAELDMCVRRWPRFRYQPRVFHYPSLAALVRPYS